MKQQLWIINSSLLLLLILTALIGFMLQQKMPRFRARRSVFEERKKAKALQPEEIENIYKYDLFGTFVTKKFVASPQQLVPPMPQPKVVTPAPTPPLPKVAFLPPLTLTLRGIAFSSDESKSVSIIEDETKKENVYHVGEAIKDAQLIKVSQNRITLLRVNGQHETIFLRKDDYRQPIPAEKKWDHLVKKIDDSHFEIDNKAFVDEIPTLGLLIDMLSPVTAFAKGKPIGIMLTSMEVNSIGSSIGLQKSDIITAIDGMGTANKKDRVKIYDKLSKAKRGAVITIALTRNNKAMTLIYTLADIHRVTKRIFAPTAPTDKQPAKKEVQPTFPMSKLQERAKQRRTFAEKHQDRHLQSLRRYLFVQIRLLQVLPD